jgi:hypothetical protein
MNYDLIFYKELVLISSGHLIKKMLPYLLTWLAVNELSLLTKDTVKVNASLMHSIG